MKNTKIIKITACCISTTIPMLALFGCAKATAVSSKMGPKVQATAKPTASAKPTATPTASTTPSATSEPEPTAEAETSEDTTAQVEDTSTYNESSSNNHSASSTPVPPAPEPTPVSTPVPTPEPTPVPPVPTPEPVDESCHVEPLGNCHVGVCMSLDDVWNQGMEWKRVNDNHSSYTYGDEDWDGCYVFYTNDGQFQVGVD